MIQAKFNGKPLHLYLSGWAMFQLDDIVHEWNEGHVPDERVTSIWNIIVGGTIIGDDDEKRTIEFDPAETLDVLFRAVEILSTGGELARKALGFEKGCTVTADELRALATPRDLLALRPAVARALEEGYTSEAEKAVEIDIFAQEIQKKTTND